MNFFTAPLISLLDPGPLIIGVLRDVKGGLQWTFREEGGGAMNQATLHDPKSSNVYNFLPKLRQPEITVPACHPPAWLSTFCQLLLAASAMHSKKGLQGLTALFSALQCCAYDATAEKHSATNCYTANCTLHFIASFCWSTIEDWRLAAELR